MELRDLVPRAHEAQAAHQAPAKPERGKGADLAEAFQSILKKEMNDLVETTGLENKLNRDFAAGKVDNIHEVMIASAKANLALETAIQIRNLAVRGFQRLTQLR